MPKILLVEDNDMSRAMLVRRLLRKGFRVCAATDGVSGIAAAQAELPDLILMDVGLGAGQMDGWEATQRLKAEPATAGTPVVALTAHATAADRLQSIEVGCAEFETKPVDFKRLIAKIEKVLEGAGNERR